MKLALAPETDAIGRENGLHLSPISPPVRRCGFVRVYNGADPSLGPFGPISGASPSPNCSTYLLNSPSSFSKVLSVKGRKCRCFIREGLVVAVAVEHCWPHSIKPGIPSI
jgi:hypothetical protein